jgi:mono/diheme cytochrome c family protein
METLMTMRYAIALVAAAGFLFMAACKNEPTKPAGNTGPNSNRATSRATPDQFAVVKTIYEKDCKECHGQNGEGGPVKLADGTKLKVPSLREGHALRHTDAEFVKQITTGGDGMPAFADKLKTEEVNDLIKFIRREFQAGATPPSK